ncbi:hypothetical protein RFEPED_1251 [Rickettsia felis str. Pedreira]|uniref:Uncharacterized protein n=1 Tax=Rickettsia felis str. Pedreira TaxID=1359196 RepID=A0A0F3MTS9_RICFI|nr:hypothetical protein RFEPED_1251 [Rickettsia felis str. Pedreira]
MHEIATQPMAARNDDSVSTQQSDSRITLNIFFNEFLK